MKTAPNLELKGGGFLLFWNNSVFTSVIGSKFDKNKTARFSYYGFRFPVLIPSGMSAAWIPGARISIVSMTSINRMVAAFGVLSPSNHL
jgi:hypothetical protein